MKLTRILNGFTQDLNEQQKDVVCLDERIILCVAGAGTGKTKTITHRVAFLVENGVSPAEILMLTFTNKAAQEMLNRSRALLPPGFGDNLFRMWGGTFHHVASRIIRKFADKLGLSRSFTIIDREDQVSIMKEVADDDKTSMPNAQTLVELYSLSVNTQLDTESTVNRHSPHLYSYMDDISETIRKYGDYKRERSLLDFDDLLYYWWFLLEEYPDVVAWHKNMFKHVLVDEFQDTSKIQGRIVELICKDPPTCLMTVGDDMQSIYSFRGADVDNILKFEESYSGAAVRKLEINYRSTPSILALANQIVAGNRNQYQKQLRTVRKDIEKPSFIICASSRDQARFVADRILELKTDCNLGDIAILYRAHYLSLDIQLELQSRHIPFEVRSGLRFFEQAHIKDVVAFLRIVDNPLDELSVKRILLMLDGIGKSCAEKIWEAVRRARGIRKELREVSVPKRAAESLSKFVSAYLKCSRSESPHEVLDRVFEGFYKDIFVGKYDDYRRRTDDVGAFIDFSARFRNITDLLSELALTSYVTSEGFAAGDGDRVICSTIHQAKGLEWKNVFLVWAVDGKLPDSRSDSAEELAEERRLFYVACTRAKDRLCITMPAASFERGNYFVCRPSRFIDELSPESYEKFHVDYTGSS